MLEFEKKLYITKKEYYLLLANKDIKTETIKQTNYYYDTESFEMNKRGITCRIRAKNGIYKATVKKHNFTEKDCSIEKTIEVSSVFDDGFFINKGLKFCGCLTTERTVIHSDDYCQLVIDKNSYLNTIDYELEIEYKSAYETSAISVLKRYVMIMNLKKDRTFFSEIIERIENSKSKSQRFFERLLSFKGE